jgi:hypothetical protein
MALTNEINHSLGRRIEDSDDMMIFIFISEEE